MISRWLLLLLLAGLAGCASMGNDTAQGGPVSTRPQGAVVVAAEGGASCVTPCVLALDSRKDQSLSIRKDGFQTQVVQLKSVFSKFPEEGGRCSCVVVPTGLQRAEGQYNLVPEAVEQILKGQD